MTGLESTCQQLERIARDSDVGAARMQELVSEVEPDARAAAQAVVDAHVALGKAYRELARVIRAKGAVR